MDSLAYQNVHRLYAEHHDWLLGWLNRRVNNRADAADLTQDTFFRVLVSPNAVVPSEPRAYLLTLARRLTIDLWRTRDVEARYLQALSQEPEPVMASPETLLMLKQAVMEIDRLLDGLPVPVKHAFLLNRLDGMTHPAIAQALGLSLATVERHVKRAFLHCIASRRAADLA
ncbi:MULTISPECIES: sigma-70 family RNA polymerase sigma factor [Achromobacter]|uniref:Sigma-70 family RNA polymerase sigma factor n=1 Tax=Alcaligenes xylosoxydans xylosoxydans TaxID=85698 RepID=A0A424WKN7_ALCXX|nr:MULTISPECIES: sigma-70 family RNA polymerase sigma factor [Achromobacter]MBC9903200.1 sigma-70 family RNA polymerase sigma factor [Achromobacter xylosoxidans]MBD0867790.1 sigma-70 family RNA polymerase sigma factor [Achromobacter xylosoxidans]MDH1301922.1 sigma-70 family RNA polymerase sigma factor [Achromobacter sp. GD03932]QNP86736.1 sigma-70 family RNA polymerase sigma factor [Achromobacter xylosoxidans]RPJ93860.1 sigma-70 family RNA polymerase sigma factor [Achromobacter xylosoxidans]